MPISPEQDNIHLFEVAWEVCQQLGGIYTVMRTKAPFMRSTWGQNYCMVGAWDEQKSPAEFQEMAPQGWIGEAVERVRSTGLDIH